MWPFKKQYKFTYLERVRIINGFYEGYVGIIKSKIDPYDRYGIYVHKNFDQPSITFEFLSSKDMIPYTDPLFNIGKK